MTSAEFQLKVRRLKQWRSVCDLAIALCALNMIGFAYTACKGGDAISGKVENGRYYLANHAIYTEVSRSIFNLNLAFIVGNFVSSPFAIAGFLAKRKIELRLRELSTVLN